MLLRAFLHETFGLHAYTQYKGEAAAEFRGSDPLDPTIRIVRPHQFQDPEIETFLARARATEENRPGEDPRGRSSS